MVLDEDIAMSIDRTFSLLGNKPLVAFQKHEYEGILKTSPKMVEKRYGPVLIVQILMLIIDLGINAAAPLLYEYYTVQLMLYVLQDTLTVMAVIIMFLSFFATYVFQAGLVSVLVWKFQATVYVSTLYLALSIVYHVWSLRLRWGRVEEYIWTPGLIAVYVLQRTGAVFYYYFYKRTALMLGDPRYHQDSPWLREEISKRS